MRAPLEIQLLAAQVRAGEKKALAKVAKVLRQHHGNRTRAAEELGIALRTLYNWAEELGIALRTLYNWAEESPKLAKVMGLDAPEAPAEPTDAPLLAALLRSRDPKALARTALALQLHGGDVSKTAKALGVSRAAFYKWAAEIPELKAVLDEHAQGKGTSHHVTFKGETKTISQWAEQLGLKRSTLSMRIAAGMPLEKALTPAERPRTRPATKKKAKKR